jgi:NAD(P)-dependent dehydrogenase (short-subunit alcohol dehydrogenase family)
MKRKGMYIHTQYLLFRMIMRYHLITGGAISLFLTLLFGAEYSLCSALSRNTDMKMVSRPTALVTGSTDGIGVTTAKNLAAKGYNVLIHGRSEKRVLEATKTIQTFSKNSGAKIFPLPAQDISTVKGCESLVQHVLEKCQQENLQLSILMNNAGVYEEKLQTTKDGLEMTFAVNVMAPFIITSHLLPTLLKQKSRIVIASSISQCSSIRHWGDLHYSKRPFSAHGAYSESKLFDAMLCMEFAERFTNAGIGTDKITCNCLDPGTVNTKMLLAGWGRCGIDVEDALDETWLCTSDEVEDVTGRYFVWKSDRTASRDAYDKKEREKMWQVLSKISPKAANMWNFE